MDEREKIEALASGGVAAARFLAGETTIEHAAEIMFPELPGDWMAQFIPAVDFLKVAGGAGGEAVYRWMAMKGLHSLPVGGYAKVQPELRLFFEAFAAVVVAATPLMFPDEGRPKPIIPQHDHDDHDKIFDKAGRIDERVGGGRGPLTTAGVPVYVPPERRAETVAAMLAAEGRTMVGRRQSLPSAEEMAAMTVEERRRYLHLDPRFADPAFVTKAPPLDDFTEVKVATAHGVGTVLVPPGDPPLQVDGPEAGGGDGIGLASPPLPIPSSGSIPPRSSTDSAGEGDDAASPARSAPIGSDAPRSAMEGGAGGSLPLPPASGSRTKGAKH